MLFVNVLIMLFIAVLVLFALRKRIKASKDNQPVYDDNGILIGYVDKNMMFHEISRNRNNNFTKSEDPFDPFSYDALGRVNPIESATYNPFYDD